MRFRSSKVVGFVEPRFRYFHSFPSLDARFVQRFRWYTDVGLESKTEVQLERPVGENWFFRSTSTVYWYEDEDEDGFFPDQGLKWTRSIDEQRVFSTSVNGYFSTDPQTVLDSAVIDVRHRQQTWRR